MSDIEVVAEDNNGCGEGPIWDCERSRLVWADLSGRLVYQLTPKTGTKEIICRGLMVSGIALNRTGEFIFGGTGGLHLWRGPHHYCTLVSEGDGQPLCVNDLIADPKGRIYAGTLYLAPNGINIKKPGRLFLISRDGAIRTVEDGTQIANGLGFSTDNRILYFTDSALRRIYAYDVNLETGELSNKRIFVEVPKEEGFPDGLTVDQEGFVWSAQWYGAQVVRYDPDGKVQRRIRLPVTQVSSLAFGGSDLTDLYVTTANEPWISALVPPGYDYSLSNTGGSLYRIRLEVQGKPEHRAYFAWPVAS